MSAEILSRRDGSVLTLTLNRPEHGNAASDEMVAELAELVRGAAAAAEIVVVRGAGTDFCTGRARMGVRLAREPEALERRRTSDVVFGCYDAIRNSAVPVIAVVQGRAIGFGCSLASVCDITLAGAGARFELPEMAHAILPTVVMSCMVDRAPRKAIAHLVYSGAVIGPHRALEFGLVSEVVADAALDKALDRLTAAMLKAQPLALRGVKEYLRTAPDMAIAGAVDYARNLHATINSSSEMRRPRG